MCEERPAIPQSGIYGAKRAAELLGISRSTLYEYTKQGLVKAHTRKCSGRLFWLGIDLLTLWNIVK